MNFGNFTDGEVQDVAIKVILEKAETAKGSRCFGELGESGGGSLGLGGSSCV